MNGMRIKYLASAAAAALFPFLCLALPETGGIGKLEFRKVPESRSSTAIARKGEYLYTCGWSGMTVYDIRKPLEPRPVWSSSRITGGRQMRIENELLYLTARENGLWILDISRPEKPVVVTRFDTTELATGLAVSGPYVFVTERIYGTEILNCSDPRNPRFVGMVRGGEIQSAAVRGNLLFGGSWGGGSVLIWDISDAAHPKRLSSFPLNGFGDGVALAGNLLYAATGMHAKSGPVAERKNNGHGLEIIDVSDPRNPRRLGRIRFPARKVKYFDSWSVTLEGTVAYVTDSNNGVFVVDAADPEKPELLAAGCPEYRGEEECAGSLALGDGCIYLGGMRGGLYVAPFPLAKSPAAAAGRPVVMKETPPAEVPGFQRIDVGGQARRLFLEGNTLYAACSSQGIRVFRVEENGLKILKTWPVACCYDVAVRDGVLYSAEGRDGLAVYRIQPDGSLTELGRERRSCIHLCLVSNPRYLIASSQGMEFYIKDVSDPGKIRTVLTCRPGGLFYTDTAGDRDVNGILPVNCHGGGVVWLDLRGEKPVVLHHARKFLSGQSSAPCAMEGTFIFPTASGYAMFHPDQPEKEMEERRSVPGIRRPGGTGTADGTVAAFTDRADGRIDVVDFSDPAHPRLLKNRSVEEIPGNPGRPVFWNHRLIIPAGFYGILFENPKQGDGK